MFAFFSFFRNSQILIQILDDNQIPREYFDKMYEIRRELKVTKLETEREASLQYEEQPQQQYVPPETQASQITESAEQDDANSLPIETVTENERENENENDNEAVGTTFDSTLDETDELRQAQYEQESDIIGLERAHSSEEMEQEQQQTTTTTTATTASEEEEEEVDATQIILENIVVDANEAIFDEFEQVTTASETTQLGVSDVENTAVLEARLKEIVTVLSLFLFFVALCFFVWDVI